MSDDSIVNSSPSPSPQYFNQNFTQDSTKKSKKNLYIGIFIGVFLLFCVVIGVTVYFTQFHNKTDSGSATKKGSSSGSATKKGSSSGSGTKKGSSSGSGTKKDDEKGSSSGSGTKKDDEIKDDEKGDGEDAESGNDSNTYTYTATSNPNTQSKFGCPYTIGLTTSDATEDYVKKTCDVDPKCVGYYIGSGGWCIATKTLPKDCTDNSGTAGYSVFKSKSSNYTSEVNPKNKFGCIYNPGLTTSDATEDYVKKTCDVDPKCVGYYRGGIGGWCVATQTLPKDCKNATGQSGYTDFMQKVKA